MAVLEQFVLDGLALNDATFTLEAVTDTPAAKKPEWVSGADSDGALLGRPPRSDNAVVELRIRVAQQATMDLALAKVALVVNKLQECEQNVYGLPLTWTPADATTAALTARVLLGEITDLPKDWQDSGWFVRSPVFTVRLTRLPFWEGAEYLAGSVTSSDPIQVLTLTGVTGDALDLGRLVVTDVAAQARRWVAWGLESRWLPTSGAPSLIVDSASMVTTGFAGVTATRSGAYSGASNNVISATLRTEAQAICGLGNLSHVGSFRPQLRFYASATTMNVRLTFQTLDGPFRSLSYRTPAVAAGWNHVDLGLVSLPVTTLNAQRWTGRIEAQSSATGGETLDVDAMWLMPAEVFGRARATSVYVAGVITALDDFTGTASGAALGTRAAPVGGSWSGAGGAGDYTFTDVGGERLSRTTVSDGGPRYAVLGTTSSTNQEVAVLTEVTAGLPEPWLLARYVDTSNYLAAGLRYGGVQAWRVFAYVAGVTTVLGEIPLTLAYNTTYRMRVIVYASGRLTATLLTAAGGVLSEVRAYHSSLETGGALASGRPGIADQNPNSAASTRYYDNFYASTPAAEPIVCYASQSIEFRHDSTLREDASGTYAGPPPEYVGGRFTVPPAGGPGRQARIAVMAKRNDVETMADDNIADSTTVQAFVTPRYVAVPRA